MPNDAAGRCRHCARKGQLRRRGLCRSCYFVAAVRKLYPRDARNAPRKKARSRVVLPEPTAA
jgi:hypothetical protein